jgi:hypothetical protein
MSSLYFGPNVSAFLSQESYELDMEPTNLSLPLNTGAAVEVYYKIWGSSLEYAETSSPK